LFVAILCRLKTATLSWYWYLIGFWLLSVCGKVVIWTWPFLSHVITHAFCCEFVDLKSEVGV
jgi:hypothetical protein